MSSCLRLPTRTVTSIHVQNKEAPEYFKCSEDQKQSTRVDELRALHDSVQLSMEQLVEISLPGLVGSTKDGKIFDSTSYFVTMLAIPPEMD